MRTSTDWRAVLAAAACGVAVAFNVGKVPIAMTELRAEFGLSLVAAGWMSSMINTLAVCTGLAFGILGDRFGALRTCYAGLGTSMLGVALGLVAASEGSLLLSRFLEGTGLVAVAVSAPALLTSAAAPTDQRFALGIWSSYLPAGVGLIMLLAPLILPFGGWRGLWLVSLMALAMSALAVRRSEASYAPRPAATPATEVSPWRVARAALARPAPWLLAFAMLSWTLQHYALIIWLPTFLTEQRGLGMLATSLLSCVMVLANVPGNLIGGSLLQRGWQRGKLIAGASLVTGLCGAGIFLDGLPDTLRYALCVLLSFTGGLIPASVLSASAHLATTPRQIGTLQGLFMQMGNVGPFVGPPLIAAIVAASGLWRDALWVTGSAAAGGILLGLALRRFDRH
ncbi:MAG: MFS transporter [Rhodocyclales bacterium]|nr:MFS transporter [Rhodocyclales bacterium]